MKEKIAEQLFLNDWDEGLLQGEILNGNWEESPKYLKNRYREQAKEKLALIAEEVRAIKNLYEPVVKVVSGDTLYIDDDVNRYDVVENFRQKVLGLLEEK